MSETTGAVETRDEAVERIVREMIDAGEHLTTRAPYGPELDVLNQKLGEAFDEAVEAGLEDDEGWDEVKGKERDAVTRRVRKAQGGEDSTDDGEDSGGGAGAGPNASLPQGVTPPKVYPTHVYQPGHASKIVADEAAFLRAVGQGFKPFRDHTIAEQRQMHSMWQNGQLLAND